MLSDTAPFIAVGDVYCVTAHPYIRWAVVAVSAGPGAEMEIVLRSSADPAVQRNVSVAVLCNPLRFQRVTS
jgi:hypothetical protein